jgi:exportin-1
LIQLREFSGDEETADLFVEETEAAKEKKAEAEREKGAAVPGLIKPADMVDEEL